MAIRVPIYEPRRTPGKELGISPVLGGQRRLNIPTTLAPPLSQARVGTAEVELWRTVGEVAKEVLDYQRQLRQAELASELSTAKADLFIDLSGFEDRLITEGGDPKKYLEDYQNFIQSRKASFDKNLSEPVKKVFNDYFRREAQKGFLRIKEEAGRQIRENLRGDLNKLLDVHSRGLASKDQTRRLQAWALYQQAVDMARQTKAIDPETAEMHLATGQQRYHRANAWDVIGWIGYEEGIKWLKGEREIEALQSTLDILDPVTKEGLIRRAIAESSIITAKTKQARDLAISTTQTAFLKKMETFLKMSTEDVIAFRNEIVTSRNLEPVGTGSKEKFLTIITKRTKETAEGKAEAVRHRTYLAISLQAYQGTMKDISFAIDAAAREEITVADIGLINNIIKETQNPALKEYNELMSRAITSGRKRILEPDLLSLFMFTADSEKQAHLFDEALRKKLAQAPDYPSRTKLLDPASKEYIVESLIQTFKAQIEEPEIPTGPSKERRSLGDFYK
jgi:hypothetical protein